MHEVNQPISDLLARTAVDELLLLGYTIEGEDLNPPQDSAAWCALAAERLGQVAGTAERPERVNGRDRFELAYATAWRAESARHEAVEELAKVVSGWRVGNTYPGDLLRLRFAWEGFQWATSGVAGAPLPPSDAAPAKEAPWGASRWRAADQQGGA